MRGRAGRCIDGWGVETSSYLGSVGGFGDIQVRLGFELKLKWKLDLGFEFGFVLGIYI